MLRTNLATRPFYNDRAVRIGIAVVAVLVAALTVFNILQVLSLTARSREIEAEVQRAEQLAAQHQQAARTIAATLDKADITAVQEAAREANLIIERRAFSWTDLFNRFETTLPADVRITSVQPQIDRQARLLVSATVVARRVEDLNEFMDRLEAVGGLRDVISRQDLVNDDGTLTAVIQGYYHPGAAEAPPADAAAEGGGNVTPSAGGAPSAPDGGPR